jgi:hypothetical protein
MMLGYEDEFRWLRATNTAVRERESERQRIAREVADYLGRGGEIQVCPPAASGWEGKTFDLGFKIDLSNGRR